MFKLLSILVMVLFVITGIAVGVLNPTSVSLNLFVVQVELPLSVIMAALLVVGMAVGAFIIFMQVLRLRWVIRRKVKENQKLSDQIIQLKKASVEIKETLKKDSNALVKLEK